MVLDTSVDGEIYEHMKVSDIFFLLRPMIQITDYVDCALLDYGCVCGNKGRLGGE